MNLWMEKMYYIYKIKYSLAIKTRKSHHLNNMNETIDHCVKWNKPDTAWQVSVSFHSYMKFKTLMSQKLSVILRLGRVTGEVGKGWSLGTKL